PTMTTPPPSPTPTVSSPSPTPSTTPPTPSTSPTPSPTPTAACPVAGKNVPGGADPWGGCWPGPGNTGVPAGMVLTPYTGPCIIAVPTVIDSQLVTCDLSIQSTGVVIRNSEIHGSIDGGEDTGSSFTLTDSLVTNPARVDCLCVGSDNFTVVRS